MLYLNQLGHHWDPKNPSALTLQVKTKEATCSKYMWLFNVIFSGQNMVKAKGVQIVPY